MLIDWFTVGAQTLNFIVLVWLMKRFLYQPILHAIDEREKRIASQLADADAKRAEAVQATEALHHKNEEFDEQRAALLNQATNDARAERARLLEEARKAATAVTAKRQETLLKDAAALGGAITRRAQEQVFAVARKVLSDLATVSLDRCVAEVFARRLRELNGPAKERLAIALSATSEPALLRSAFELPAVERAAIQNSLNQSFAAEVSIRFEVAPDLVSGVELICGGQKVGWSIAHYLGALTSGVVELLEERATAANSAPKLAQAKREAPTS